MRTGTQIAEGMVARSSDGEKLGKIIACRSDGFMIEGGFLAPKNYLARYQDVAEVRGNDVILTLTRKQVLAQDEEPGEMWGVEGAREERP